MVPRPSIPKGVARTACEADMPQPLTPRSRAADAARLLASDSAEVRERACQELCGIPVAALAPHASVLAACLSDSHYRVRWAACVALAELDARVSAHAPKLLLRLGDATDLVRWAAVDTLAVLPAADLVKIAPALADRWCVDPEPRARCAALDLLGRLPSGALAVHAEAVLDRFNDEDAGVRSAAIETFRRSETKICLQHIVAVTSLLDDVDEKVRGTTQHLFLELDQDTLLELVGHSNVKTRCAALNTITAAEPHMQRSCAAAVAERLADSDPAVVLAALRAMEKLDPPLLANYSSDIAVLLGDSLNNSRARRKAVRVLAKLDSPVLAEFAPLLAQLLDDGDDGVRQATQDACAKLQPSGLVKLMNTTCDQARYIAVALLGNLASDVLACYAESIAQQLNYPCARIRLEAIRTLSKLAVEDKCRHVSAIIHCLSDTDSRTREAALMALGDMNQALLSEHIGHVLRMLDDRDAIVRRAGLEAIGKSDGPTLSFCARRVVCKLDDADVAVRRSALKTLQVTDRKELAFHGQAIAQRLRDADSCVRKLTVDMLATLEPCSLEEHAVGLSSLLDDKDPSLQQAACAALARLTPAFLSDMVHATLLRVSCGDLPLHLAARHGWLQTTQTLVTRHRMTLLHATNDDGSTPLHLAAEQGHLDICNVLVEFGALIKVKNKSQRSPVDLARGQEHKSIVEFFESRRNTTTLRGGSGNALSLAKYDAGRILGVEWYTLTLLGTAGSMGVSHSLLAITVGGQADPPRTYVIEKAAVPATETHSDLCQNGVYVSHWVDVVPSIEGSPIHSIQGRDLDEHRDADDMVSLWRLAVGMGPYDVARCNCHHMAFVLFNACASASARVPHMPNATLTWAASMLRFVGINVEGSELASGSSGSQLKSTSAASVASAAGAATSVKCDARDMSVQPSQTFALSL